MNFEYMPELHSRYGYFTVWVIMIVSGRRDVVFLLEERVGLAEAGDRCEGKLERHVGSACSSSSVVVK